MGHEWLMHCTPMSQELSPQAFVTEVAGVDKFRGRTGSRDNQTRIAGNTNARSYDLIRMNEAPSRPNCGHKYIWFWKINIYARCT